MPGSRRPSTGRETRRRGRCAVWAVSPRPWLRVGLLLRRRRGASSFASTACAAFARRGGLESLCGLRGFLCAQRTPIAACCSRRTAGDLETSQNSKLSRRGRQQPQNPDDRGELASVSIATSTEIRVRGAARWLSPDRNRKTMRPKVYAPELSHIDDHIVLASTRAAPDRRHDRLPSTSKDWIETLPAPSMEAVARTTPAPRDPEALTLRAGPV